MMQGIDLQTHVLNEKGMLHAPNKLMFLLSLRTRFKIGIGIGFGIDQWHTVFESVILQYQANIVHNIL